jgi:hypothetical protein
LRIETLPPQGLRYVTLQERQRTRSTGKKALGSVTAISQ